MTPQKLLEYCISEISDLSTGEAFIVRDLFKGYEWVRLPRASRITLGTLFFNYASNCDVLKLVGKTAQGQQKYEKL